MTGTLTIAARELRGRSFVFIAAAMMALVPFVAALVENGRSGRTSFVIMTVGMMTATGLTLGLALTLGVSIVGRELSERRLSFYFSKPVSELAIWFGKIIAASATIAICFAMTFLPAFAVARAEWRSMTGWPLSGFIAVVLGAAVYLLLLAHAASTAVRSRSPLVALDLALLAGGSALVWRILRSLLLNGAHDALAWTTSALLWTVPVVILAAGAWQLSRGRTEIRRSHRELSRFFWIAMAVVIAIAAGYAAWVLSASPRDLTIKEAAANASGDWVAVTGTAQHRGDYSPTFLVDLKSGGSYRLEGSSRFFGRADFTRRGDAVLSFEPSDALQPLRGELRLHRLTGNYSNQPTGIFTDPWSAAVMSDDLTRAAVFQDGLLSVHDIKAKSLVGSVKIPSESATSFFFVSDDVVRLVARNIGGSNTQATPRELRVYEFDVRTRQLTQTGSFSAVAKSLFTRMNADGSTLVVNEYGGPAGSKTHVLDGRTCAERFSVAGQSPFAILPLQNGGVAYIDSSFLKIADDHGVTTHSIPLGQSGRGFVREMVPGKSFVVNLARKAQAATGADWTALVVDVDRNQVVRVERAAQLKNAVWMPDPRVPAANPAGEYVLADANNTLWRWNALTGAKSKIF